MNLGFKDQFVPMVEDGSKRHSIRAGFRWKVGMRADLYARPRQKGMRLIFRAQVVKVEQIFIIDEPGTGCLITIAGVRLTQDEADLFAWRDGFRWRPSPCVHCCNWANCNTLEACRQIGYPKDAGCFDRMMLFWSKTHDLAARPFVGQIIHWDYEQRFMDIRETCFRESARRARGGLQ